MADIETGAEPTTADAPAQATTPSGEPVTDVFDLGISEAMDEVAPTGAPQEEDAPDENGDETRTAGTDADPSGPTDLHESLKPLQELRLKDPEATKAWNEHLKGLDKTVRKLEADRASFDTDHQNAVGMLNEIKGADTAEKAMDAIATVVAALEKRYGYTLGKVGESAQTDDPDSQALLESFTDPDDKKFADSLIKAAQAPLLQKIAAMERKLGVVDQITTERQQEAQRAETISKIKAEAPAAIEKVASWGSGWKPTDAQAQEAGLKFPNLPLEDAMFLAFKGEIMAHKSKVGVSARKTQTTVPHGAGAKAQVADDPYDLNVERAMSEVTTRRS